MVRKMALVFGRRGRRKICIAVTGHRRCAMQHPLARIALHLPALHCSAINVRWLRRLRSTRSPPVGMERPMTSAHVRVIRRTMAILSTRRRSDQILD